MILGEVRGRQVTYLNIRREQEWFLHLPESNWIAFTITDEEDRSLTEQVVNICLDENVGYICSAGDIGHFVEDCFDEEIASRAVALEMKTGNNFNSENFAMTTAHRNFNEGFWFATSVAYTEPLDLCKVVCLDFTTKGVKKHLLTIIGLINNGWLPNDLEVEKPIYD